MSQIRAQITFPFFTNLPTDVITNTLYFQGSGTFAEDYPDLVAPLNAFYESCYAIGIANYIDEALATIKFYDMEQPAPRVPEVESLAFDVTNSVSTVPTEVAAVLSFQGNQVSGVPQARRRGRIYLGGLVPAQLTASAVDAFPILAPAFITDIVDAAEVLRDTTNGLSIGWRVYSPTLGTFAAVSNGWVDNSPDTQRRRSVNASQRTLWS